MVSLLTNNMIELQIASYHRYTSADINLNFTSAAKRRASESEKVDRVSPSESET